MTKNKKTTKKVVQKRVKRMNGFREDKGE